MMRKKLIIVGASGHGKVVADVAIKMNQWQEIVFIDNNESLTQSLGLDVVGTTDDAFKYKLEADFFVAVGKNQVRKKIQEKLISGGCNVVSLIHPQAIIGLDVQIGIGTVVMAGVVINSSSRIGVGCIINTSSSIDHDNNIGNYVHISPGVRTAGTVEIGDLTWLGIGSAVSNNLNISSECIVGASSLVNKSIIEPGTYIGIPVKRVKT